MSSKLQINENKTDQEFLLNYGLKGHFLTLQLTYRSLARKAGEGGKYNYLHHLGKEEGQWELKSLNEEST